jgi:hypothetical protein
MMVGLQTSCLPHKDIPDSLKDEELKPVIQNKEARKENGRDTDEKNVEI